MWTEGIDYEMLEGGKVRCRYCQQILQSKAGLGPHLSSCSKRKSLEPTAEEVSGEAAPVPEEAEVLRDILVKFGMKGQHAAGVASLMSYSGWNNFMELKAFCSNCGMSPDRISLVLRAWSNHRGVVVPADVLSDLQGSQLPGTDRGVLTETRLREILEQRDREKENVKLREELGTLKNKVATLEKGGANPDSDVLWKERESRLKAERRLEVYEAVDTALRNVPHTGKSTVDLIADGMERIDKRAERFESIFMKRPSFNPQVTRTTNERKEKAKSIEQTIAEKEKMLKLENEFIDSCLPCFGVKES